jgi:hypothetical protein
MRNRASWRAQLPKLVGACVPYIIIEEQEELWGQPTLALSRSALFGFGKDDRRFRRVVARTSVEDSVYWFALRIFEAMAHVLCHHLRRDVLDMNLVVPGDGSGQVAFKFIKERNRLPFGPVLAIEVARHCRKRRQVEGSRSARTDSTWPATLLDRYSHWIPSMGRHAADGMDEALG